MKHIKLFEMYFGGGSGFELGKKLAAIDSIVKKCKAKMDKNHEYTADEISKAITEHGGTGALHSDDIKKVIDELKDDGFKIKGEGKKDEEKPEEKAPEKKTSLWNKIKNF
jgi:hypothetical protein